MSAFRFPTVFLSHGTPMHAFGEDPYQQMLQAFSLSLPKPKALIFISAHSVSDERVHVLSAKENRIQYDFNGFPDELYQIKYKCPGDPILSEQVAQLFKDAGFESTIDEDAPLDHGIWIPLSHLYPKGDVPVIRVSLPLNLLPAQILKMGHTVSKLREQGIMVVGTGGAVHNLGALKWNQKNGTGADWATQFEEWIIATLRTKNVEALIGAEEQPFFKKSHPSSEHFLPLLFVVGAALQGDQVNVLFRGIEYDSLSMLCFSLNHEQALSLH